jgi:hypothetical protein
MSDDGSPDARFEDADDRPLRLIAQDAAGLEVISALLQDAVFPITEMRFARTQHRFAVLVNRFRWEGNAPRTPPERARALLVFNDVLAVRSQGIARAEAETVLSLLSLRFEPGDEGAGRVILTLAGDGAIALEVEALDATLEDVSQPYVAPSGKIPSHPI